MDRHVIKGRGENRDKYLCWARVAPAEKPTEDGFVWLAEQRKAVRWPDPRYSGHTWATARAKIHNGYFVKLVAPPVVTRELVDELRSFIAAHAAGAAEKLACYWFDGDFHDASDEFCRDCAEKLVDKKYAAARSAFEELYGECESDEERYSAAIDGGFDTDHDSRPYCETCRAKLSGHLTDYGADEEIEALTTDCAPDFDDAEGWEALDDAIINLSDDDPRWRRIAKVVDAAREAERENEARLAALAAAPGMAEARGGLLSLLAARQEQKAPEPSYRLWPEFLRWRALPIKKRLHPAKQRAAWEHSLWKEAKSFLALFGYQPSGECFKAPYGTYHWPFVVAIEQYRLWQTPAFVEGVKHKQAPWPPANPKRPAYRDANPYPEGTEEHTAWDAGYMCTESPARPTMGVTA